MAVNEKTIPCAYFQTETTNILGNGICLGYSKPATILSHTTEQLAQAPQPLLLNMKRCLLDKFNPISDKEPEVTAHFRAIIRDAIEGAMRADDYTAQMWKGISPQQKEVQSELHNFGDFVSLTLVDRSDVDGQRSYRDRMEFKNASVLQHFVLDKQNKLASGQWEDTEWKSNTDFLVH